MPTGNLSGMLGFELVLFLLAASIALRMFAERWRIPYATLLVLGGLALAQVPRLPRLELSPDLLFLIFIPPLLYAGAIAFPLRDLRRESGPILRLALVMVLVSTTAVAIVICAIDPKFTWAAAFALGAIVSPPDPVAVLSLMRWLGLPREVERILEGEGLLNDATALVLYRVAVGAAVTGAFSLSNAALQILVNGTGGALVGLAIGLVVRRAHRLTRSVDVAENTVSLLTPFVAFLAAEGLHVSGVISVVAAGMYVARYQQIAGTPSTRLQNRAMWEVTSFLLESLIFIIIGIQLPYIVRDLRDITLGPLVREAIIVCVTVIVARIVWIFPSAYVGRAVDRWFARRDEPLPSWRTILFVGWAGIRGGDSLAIALALPLTTITGNAFPARNRIVFITFCVILATLVLQGITLRPMARALGLGADRSAGDEEVHARLTSAEAGLRVLDEMNGEWPNPEVVRYLRQRHRQRARRWAAQERRRFSHGPAARHSHSVVSPPSHEEGRLDERRAAEYSRVRSRMIATERQSLLDLRDKGELGDDVMRRIQRELDLEEMLLEGEQPVVEPPREAPLGEDS